jgi:hypothetical protein
MQRYLHDNFLSIYFFNSGGCALLIVTRTTDDQMRFQLTISDRFGTVQDGDEGGTAITSDKEISVEQSACFCVYIGTPIDCGAIQQDRHS